MTRENSLGPAFDPELLGWRPHFAELYAPYRDIYQAGRVASERRGRYILWTGEGELCAIPAGRMTHTAEERAGLPAVGDWVLYLGRAGETTAVIHRILPRLSKFTRLAAGRETEEQVLAANIDLAFLCMGLDANYNPRRMERYLAAAWEGGVTPMVVLTKRDLCVDMEERIKDISRLAAGAGVVAVSAIEGTGLDEVRRRLGPGMTAAFLGPSGVGKSTLINRLAGRELQATGEVRASDGRGRHTTTGREMIPLPGGGILIDTPGLRELGLLGNGAGLWHAFADIDELARECRFSDCRHLREPGCAVREAVAAGVLPEERLDNYLKLQKEEKRAERKMARRLAMPDRRRRKAGPRIKKVEGYDLS